MPNMQVKNVPDDVHAALRRRAALDGKSLQDYLLGRLAEDALTPTLDEVLDRVGYRSGGTAGFDAAAQAVRSGRDAL